MKTRKHRKRLITHWELDAWRIITTVLTIVLLFGVSYQIILAQVEVRKQEWIDSLVTPLSDKEIVLVDKEVIKTVEVDKPDENIPGWVQKYVDQYFQGYQRSEMYMIMHCLLHRESGHQPHNENGPHGDSGKAGGLMQFWGETYERMRKEMIKQGEVTEIGSRYNPEDAIHTAVWAIKNGNGLEWGPLARSAKGSDFATCQVPSFYK